MIIITDGCCSVHTDDGLIHKAIDASDDSNCTMCSLFKYAYHSDDGCQIPCLAEERKDNRDVYFIVLN